MKRQPLVSIVITSFNNSDHIEAAIQSAVSQRYRNIEVIVVDDCSSDGSVELLKRRFSSLQLHVNQENYGVSVARNIGYEMANGEYVTQLDGDDIFHPLKIEREVQVACEKPGSIVASSTFIFNEDCEIEYDVGERCEEEVDYKKVKFWKLKYRLGQFGRDWLIPAELAKAVKYDEKRNLYEDWQVKIRLALCAEVFMLNSIGTYYRQTLSGLSSKSGVAHKEALFSVFEATFTGEPIRMQLFKGLQELRELKSNLSACCRVK